MDWGIRLSVWLPDQKFSIPTEEAQHETYTHHNLII